MRNSKLTRNHLIDEVSEKVGLSRRQAKILVNTFFDGLIETLQAGEKIELRGFGSFQVRERGAHRARNPATGEKVDVPVTRKVYFKPSKELHALLDEQSVDYHQ